MIKQNAGMPIRVTFDTNTLDKAVRPERFPKDILQAEYQKVYDALKIGAIEGFICETIVTCEGIQKKDRAETYGSTKLVSKQEHKTNEDGDDIINISLTPEMSKLKPLHPEVIRRLQAAFALKIKVLGAPRIGGLNIDDPNNEIYFQETPNSAEQSARLERQFEAGREIEARGVGFSQLKELAGKFASRANLIEPWFKSLERAIDVHEMNSVNRAVAEWADGDTLAAHIGYGIDFFCTEDAGKSAGARSILDANNQAWLRERFGVKIISMSDLAKMV